MATSRWLPGLRALLTIGRELHTCAVALTRIADRLEGKTSFASTTSPDAPDDLDVSYLTPEDAQRIDAESRRLTPLLGRPPTPEELFRSLDGVEWTADDAAAHLAAVRRDLGRG